MRTLEILKIIKEYFIFYNYNKHSKKVLSRRIREACEKLGPTFIKLGQILSTRYDLFSKKDCEELQNLLDNVRPIPYSEIKEIFKHDFGKYPCEIFLEFDENHIASASLSQVYKARLKSGELVAVKIKKPGMEKRIKKDMKIIKQIFKVAQIFSPSLKALNSVMVLKEFERILLQEVDFENEKRNIINIQKYYSFKDKCEFRNKFGGVSFVDVYPEFCSKNVLTLNFIEGIPLNKISKIADNSEYDIIASLGAYLNLSIYVLFNKKYCLFPVDPHPANLIIQKNGKVAVIDLGAIEFIGGENLAKVKNLFFAVYSQNLDESVKCALKMCGADYNKNVHKIRNDFKRFLSEVHDKGVGFWFIEPLKIFVKHGIRGPSFLSSFGRSNLVFDGNIKMINPEITTIDLIGNELKSALKNEIVNNFKEIKYESLLYNISEKVKHSPELFNRFIDKYYNKPEKILLDIGKTIKILNKS